MFSLEFQVVTATQINRPTTFSQAVIHYECGSSRLRIVTEDWDLMFPTQQLTMKVGGALRCTNKSREKEGRCTSANFLFNHFSLWR